jgi:hypothetical protein
LDFARRARVLHAVVGAIVCVGLPGGSYVFGHGALAYGMFAETRLYELQVRAIDADGRERDIESARLAQATSGATAIYFAGLDHFRRGPAHAMPRAHLGDIARLACSVSGAASVVVTLRERARPDAPIESTTRIVRCAP